MAQYIVAAAAPSRAITCTLLNESNLSLVATATSAVELSAGNGIYTITFASVPAGSYRLLVVDDLTTYGIASYKAVFTGVSDEVVQASEYTAGGDASESKQDQILAAISPITTVYSPQVSSETLTLVVGDAYDGVANSKLSWTVSKNIDAATGFNFTIRDKDDAIVLDQDTAGVTTAGSGTTVEVSLSSAATLLLDSAESDYQFDYEVVFSADSRWTITRGVVCVEGHQSR